MKKIHFDVYRKLINLDIKFTPNINVISGINGTCKSSILHIISNSFQKVKADQSETELKQCLNTITAINEQFNPKLESLTRGDKEFQNPAPNHQGTYYTVDYYGDNPSLSFRKHNSKKNAAEFRYAVKPQYKQGSGESLPSIPVIYLGLNRLLTYGEYKDTEPIKSIRKSMPDEYLTELSQLYKSFTNYEISHITNEHMGSVKIRADFNSTSQGIDSNTISAGEDNLYIILSALESLRYYYKTLPEDKHSEVDSILLIDEFDATLHPAFQFKLFDLVLKYSIDYKIQVVFTSHSLTLLEYCLKKSQNLIYLFDNHSSVHLIEKPNIHKINLYLKEITNSDFSFEKKIPVFTEDSEARYLLNIIFDYYAEKYDGFSSVRNYFYFVDANIGGDVLHSMFKDPKLKTFTGQFCIVDGDKSCDLTNRVISLPGKASPEVFLIDYAKTLYDRDDPFWISDPVLEENMSKNFYTSVFLSDVNAIKQKIDSLHEVGDSAKGVKRSMTKELFNKHLKFFHILFDTWLLDKNNQLEINTFYNNLYVMFKQVAQFNGIDVDLWNK
ncbi:MAG: AAA family ATPase [Porcipelethomonas sp.]